MRYREIKEEFKKDGTYLIRAMTYEQTLDEESPNNLNGSFTEDLVDSKKWLCKKLKQIVGDQNLGKIYILGSWYGNLGIYLQDFDIKFDILALVELDKNLLKKSKELLPKLYDENRLELINKDATQISFQEPCTIINCSSNEMNKDWLNNIPKKSLVCIQARNNIDKGITKTETLNDFNKKFSVTKTLYINSKKFKDPKKVYDRFLKIGII